LLATSRANDRVFSLNLAVSYDERIHADELGRFIEIIGRR
jgi:hypothetical protein